MKKLIIIICTAAVGTLLADSTWIGANCNTFASMSGMLDLSRDEKAKHFLPRWLRKAPAWIRVDLSMMRKQSSIQQAQT